MIRTKFICESFISDFESSLDDALQEIEERGFGVKDIKLSTAIAQLAINDPFIRFTALIIFEG